MKKSPVIIKKTIMVVACDIPRLAIKTFSQLVFMLYCSLVSSSQLFFSLESRYRRVIQGQLHISCAEHHKKLLYVQAPYVPVRGCEWVLACLL